MLIDRSPTPSPTTSPVEGNHVREVRGPRGVYVERRGARVLFHRQDDGVAGGRGRGHHRGIPCLRRVSFVLLCFVCSGEGREQVQSESSEEGRVFLLAERSFISCALVQQTGSESLGGFACLQGTTCGGSAHSCSSRSRAMYA